jgi:dihydrofolate reductase
MEGPVGKVLWHITMSLDGFIAAPNDDMTWLADYLLTHDPPETAAAGFTFVSGDVREAVAAAKNAAGDGYLVVLGANAAKQCLDAGVLDEVLVHIAPVLLGDGVRMFFRPGGANVKLERISLTESPRVTNLWLRVVR